MGRTTPVWLSLESLITLTAHRLTTRGPTVAEARRGMPQHAPRFRCDRVVRRPVWDQSDVSPSHQDTDMLNIPRALLERFTEALGYAA